MKMHIEAKNRDKNIKFVYEFIEQHKIGVMATVTGDFLPEAAVMGIAVLGNLDIICSSYFTSRKYSNLQKNPRVALVIGWERGKTVQYEGLAEELPQEEAEEQLETTLEKIPTIAKYLELEHQVLYKIKPKWVRYEDLSKEPWERFELNF